MGKSAVNIFWFRRDLRLDDNTALEKASRSSLPVLPLFIFDTNIIDELPEDDPRINFIYDTLLVMNSELLKSRGSLMIRKGKPVEIMKSLISFYDVKTVFYNRDYEPYAAGRDSDIEDLLNENGIEMATFCDQVIFEKNQITKSDGSPYTVFTPYKKAWLNKFSPNLLQPSGNSLNEKTLYQTSFPFPSLKEIGFKPSTKKARPFEASHIRDYHLYRDYPAADRTTFLGPHLRFGTESIRKIFILAVKENETFMNELIWREFFMQILYNFPQVVTENFRSKYDDIQWRNNESEFLRWCNGETGYPIVDAGMRQLNETGYMHNRVRMITAGFLCKHLLIDWRWGEAYFAGKLIDYELSSNNGNWQWAAGTGCDAAPWFRIFNPYTQQKKFDPQSEYLNKWVKDLNASSYPEKIIDHEYARERTLAAYKTALRPSK